MEGGGSFGWGVGGREERQQGLEEVKGGEGFHFLFHFLSFFLSSWRRYSEWREREKGGERGEEGGEIGDSVL